MVRVPYTYLLDDINFINYYIVLYMCNFAIIIFKRPQYTHSGTLILVYLCSLFDVFGACRMAVLHVDCSLYSFLQLLVASAGYP